MAGVVSSRYPNSNKVRLDNSTKLITFTQGLINEIVATSKSNNDFYNLDAYIKLISLNGFAVYTVFESVHLHPTAFFLALRVMTGERVVSPEHKGVFKLMEQDWREWLSRRFFTRNATVQWVTRRYKKTVDPRQVLLRSLTTPKSKAG